MSAGSPLAPERRPLTEAERRLLGARIWDLERQLKRGPVALLPGIAVIVVLWLVTLAAADAPWQVVTGFWTVVGAGILVWVRADQRKLLTTFAGMAASLESARRRNEADVYHIRATRFAEFEEAEDEGACYAFEIPGPHLVFVTGQMYYPQARFPSLDFSLVHILDEDDRPVDEVVEKRGPRAKPVRTIPARVKYELVIPDHLETLPGDLSQLETLLARNE